MTDETERPVPVQDPVVHARVRALHAAGKGRNAIAEELGLSTATISRVAKLLGLDFARAQTATATAAKVRTLKERRAAIVDRLYTRTEFNLTRLEAESFKTLVRGEGGAEYVDTLDFVPPEHERALVGTIQTALTAAAKLELQDGDQKADDAKSLLRNLGAALQAIPDED
ncbi:helix-turn-helix domain-containing protein [Curtobacterium albidum]|uniref:Helix-turn-helix domain-containing protein n=1 Tax=Curtobacterium citreum TaxID=2036 RepID=A0A850DQY5_9MICO|nr:helix-turn-helix domain-containing protein [Curtobacterium albidum]NUU27917.1 helix-turn-helix domain-containing protein [Curtobacterium albidum]